MKITRFIGVAPLKRKLDRHPVYGAVRNMDDLRRFMEHHIYSVWDFMSLLKFLQRHMADSQVPWMPTGDASVTAAQRFVNEIVLGEETDEGLPDIKGKPTFVSHFDLYLGAMDEVGADTRPVKAFLRSVQRNGIEKALQTAKIPEAARQFMQTTFGFIATGKPHMVAAAFALGREQVIPGMFRALLADMKISKRKAPLFHYYLERHIHLDDELHGPLSLRLLDHLCAGSKVKLRAATKAGCNAIEARIAFWDDVRTALSTQSNKRST
ncbi:MAG: DUF3050 domain-containing protein [Gammaproteobacteria bacterium]|nr:DUF3050 domain-containing protein [Gammaproteobacteria bacterium]MDD2929334.1 DUF3050 domain-containing protein [Sideroxydans sp.]